MQISGFRVQGSGFRVQGSGFRVQGVGARYRVWGIVVTPVQAGLRARGSVPAPAMPPCAALRVRIKEEGPFHYNPKAFVLLVRPDRVVIFIVHFERKVCFPGFRGTGSGGSREDLLEVDEE